MYRAMSRYFWVFEQLLLQRNYKILADKTFKLFGFNLHMNKADLGWNQIFMIESTYILSYIILILYYIIREKTTITTPTIKEKQKNKKL